MTDMAGRCVNPSVHAEVCCTDAIEVFVTVAYTNDQTGVEEVWSVCRRMEDGPIAPPRLLSTDDGVSSEEPDISGYTETIGIIPWPDPLGRYLVTWTDR